MPCSYLFTHCKANSCPFVLLPGMQPLKDLKYPVLMFGGNANTIIMYAE